MDDTPGRTLGPHTEHTHTLEDNEQTHKQKITT